MESAVGALPTTHLRSPTSIMPSTIHASLLPIWQEKVDSFVAAGDSRLATNSDSRRRGTKYRSYPQMQAPTWFWAGQPCCER